MHRKDLAINTTYSVGHWPLRHRFAGHPASTSGLSEPCSGLHAVTQKPSTEDSQLIHSLHRSRQVALARKRDYCVAPWPTAPTCWGLHGQQTLASAEAACTKCAFPQGRGAPFRPDHRTAVAHPGAERRLANRFERLVARGRASLLDVVVSSHAREFRPGRRFESSQDFLQYPCTGTAGAWSFNS